jgi:tRNA A37 threonylcarbamoyladenosine dehydratase
MNYYYLCIMNKQFERTAALLGNEALERLRQSHVAVFGVGGVGGYVCEVLARSGVGELSLFDKDCVDITNLNRQIIALHSTIGQPKVEVIARRIADINPDCQVHAQHMFYLPENADEVDLTQFSYIVDCIDNVTAKLELIRRCHRLGLPIISSMGAANKLDATDFRVSDLSKTQVDPLARILRQKLRREGIHHLKVVYSEEIPLPSSVTDESNGRPVPASNAWVPPAAGLIIGGEVVKDLIKA